MISDEITNKKLGAGKYTPSWESSDQHVTDLREEERMLASSEELVQRRPIQSNACRKAPEGKSKRGLKGRMTDACLLRPSSKRSLAAGKTRVGTHVVRNRQWTGTTSVVPSIFTTGLVLREREDPEHLEQVPGCLRPGSTGVTGLTMVTRSSLIFRARRLLFRSSRRAVVASWIELHTRPQRRVSRPEGGQTYRHP
jgi:hypothetical protein